MTRLLSYFVFLLHLFQIQATEPLAERIAEVLVAAVNQAEGIEIELPPKLRQQINQPEPRVSDHPEVNTTSGLITGSTLPESHVFYSIPYGEAPIGLMRYKPPEPVGYRGNLNKSTPDYLRCFEYPLNCTSDDDCDANYSEDCLVLTINVPSTVDLSAPPTDQLPVMFWIHGGAFFGGSGNSGVYDGRWLCNSTNTIVVTVNYRLGALGFLVYEENGETLDGNQGIKDQQLALRWVHENIEKFGGDKNKITIFGNSAGAQSVMLHLMSDVSDPYFHRAIMQSNPAAFYYPSIAEATLKTNALLKAINCSGSSDLECLRNASATDLMKAHVRVALSNELNFFNVIEPFRPNLDEVEFTEHPLDFFQTGKWQNSKEVIIGTTSEEVSYVNVYLEYFVLKESTFRALTTIVVGPDYTDAVSSKYIELAGPQPGTDYDYTDILAQEVSDMIFVCPSRALTRFMSATSSTPQKPPVYLYLDDHPMNGSNCDEVSNFCGYAYHGSENVFVFNSGENTGFIFEEDDMVVSNIFQTFWGHFAYEGAPTKDLSEWPYYISDTLSNGDIKPWTNIRIKAPKSNIENDHRKDLCDFWDSLGFYVNITSPTETSTVATTSTTSTASQKSSTTPDASLASSSEDSVDNALTTSISTNLVPHFTILSISSVMTCLITFLWA